MTAGQAYKAMNNVGSNEAIGGSDPRDCGESRRVHEKDGRRSMVVNLRTATDAISHGGWPFTAQHKEMTEALSLSIYTSEKPDLTPL
ncbi:hypothetical protein LguiB_024289 [Lonicera macranthoides]